MTRPRILVVDDDPHVVSFVEVVLRGHGLRIEAAGSGEQALEYVEEQIPDAILLDVRLPGINGLETLKSMRGREIDVPIVMVTSHATMGVAIEAMREGAYDFLTKPLRVQPLESLVMRMLRDRESASSKVFPPHPEEKRGWQIIGKSPAIIEVFKAIGCVAETDATVLITGESGTGKELVARVIHQNSRRSQARFVAVNCAAIPDQLLESELFGHEKGAFTGSVERRIGKFERAHQGTILLDEVGDMPIQLQGKILRAVEEGTIERVGGTHSMPVDVRVLAATNQDLPKAVEQGRFREDLYYRLAVVGIELPPLRERIDDVRLLVDFFVPTIAREVGRRIDHIDPEVYRRLAEYSWPGNVRELRNLLKRSLLVSRGTALRVEDLPGLRQPPSAKSSLMDRMQEFCREGKSLVEIEKAYFLAALEATEWSYARTAELLQVHRNTVRRKVAEYGLEAPSRTGAGGSP